MLTRAALAALQHTTTSQGWGRPCPRLLVSRRAAATDALDRPARPNRRRRHEVGAMLAPRATPLPSLQDDLGAFVGELHVILPTQVPRRHPAVGRDGARLRVAPRRLRAGRPAPAAQPDLRCRPHRSRGAGSVASWTPRSAIRSGSRARPAASTPTRSRVRCDARQAGRVVRSATVVPHATSAPMALVSPFGGCRRVVREQHELASIVAHPATVVAIEHLEARAAVLGDPLRLHPG